MSLVRRSWIALGNFLNFPYPWTRPALRCSLSLVPYCIHKTSRWELNNVPIFLSILLVCFWLKLLYFTLLDEDKNHSILPLLSYSLSPSEFRILSFSPLVFLQGRPPLSRLSSTLLLSFNQLHPRSITSMAPHYQQQNSIMCSWRVCVTSWQTCYEWLASDNIENSDLENDLKYW